MGRTARDEDENQRQAVQDALDRTWPSEHGHIAAHKKLSGDIDSAALPSRRAFPNMQPLIMLHIISRGIPPYTSISEAILDEVDFPVFAAGLIEGTFHAIVEVSIQQMEACADLPQKVARTMDEFNTATEPASG